MKPIAAGLFCELRKIGRSRKCSPDDFRRRIAQSDCTVRLNIGGGATEMGGHLNVDVRALLCVDICCDAFDLPHWIPDGRVAAIYSKDFVEHVSWLKSHELWTLFHRLLMPGGTLDILTPDLDLFLAAHARRVSWEQLMKCIYGRQTYPSNTHLALYNYPALATQLTAEGFICEHLARQSNLFHIRGIRQ